VAGWWLGPAGSLVQLPDPAPGLSRPRVRRRAVHYPAARGGQVTVDDLGRYAQVTLAYTEQNSITQDELAILERLAETQGAAAYRFVDGSQRNYLTPNQSSGTDALADATGFSAFTQGTVASSTAQKRTGARSLAWNTVTALGATGRGIRLFTDATTTTPDGTWAAILPSTPYTFTTYVRASAAVSMQPGMNFYDAAIPPNLVSSASGSGVAVSTTDWSTRLVYTVTSDATAAYAVPKAFNTTTTGAAITVWFDDLQLEQAGSAGAAVTGQGTPVVDVASLAPQVLWLNPPLYTAELVLEELG
jgi:hypothetical protein